MNGALSYWVSLSISPINQHLQITITEATDTVVSVSDTQRLLHNLYLETAKHYPSKPWITSIVIWLTKPAKKRTLSIKPSAPDLTNSLSASFFTPLNIVLLSAVLYTTYALLRSSPPPSLPRDTPSTVFRTYTPHTLLPFNGEENRPVFLAVRGRVFDVSPGRNFYGPGGPYSNFAGRDASRGLACGSFDEDMLTKDLDGPLDKLEGLDAEQMEALQGWEERFLEKYTVVGKLVSVQDYEAQKA
jgi:membrane-associated progesterone receptor component